MAMMKAIILIRFSAVCVIPGFNDGKFHEGMDPLLSFPYYQIVEKLQAHNNKIMLNSTPACFNRMNPSLLKKCISII